VVDVTTGTALVRGLSMPHSPRIRDGELWLLESGQGRLVTAVRATGAIATVADMPGYARGLAFAGRHAFVGLSSFRPSSLHERHSIACRFQSGRPVGRAACRLLTWIPAMKQVGWSFILASMRSST